MCPLHRCGYSLTWLDESLLLLITWNGWLVPTKVWDFLINTLWDCSVSQHQTRSDAVFLCTWWAKDVWVSMWFDHMQYVTVHVTVPSAKRQWSGTWGGGVEVRGQSALIPHPVRVSPSRMITADSSSMSVLWMSALWKGKSQPGKQITGSQKGLWGDKPQTSSSIHTPAVQ